MITFQDFKQEVTTWLPDVKRIAEHYFYGEYTVEYKDDNSPVTAADKAIEEYITNKIIARFPDHSIIGEEGTGVNHDESPFSWVLDPIDGTRSFVHGVPLFATLIAFMRDDEPLYGAIYLPITGEVVFGDGREAILGSGLPVKVRDNRYIENITLLTSSVAAINRYRDAGTLQKTISSCGTFRTWGDGYGYFMVATGRADVMVDAKMKIWDIMAIIPVIKGAGGVVTDYYGGNPCKGDSLIAGGREAHRLILDRLNSKPILPID